MVESPRDRVPRLARELTVAEAYRRYATLVVEHETTRTSLRNKANSARTKGVPPRRHGEDRERRNHRQTRMGRRRRHPNAKPLGGPPVASGAGSLAMTGGGAGVRTGARGMTAARAAGPPVRPGAAVRGAAPLHETLPQDSEPAGGEREGAPLLPRAGSPAGGCRGQRAPRTTPSARTRPLLRRPTPRHPPAGFGTCGRGAGGEREGSGRKTGWHEKGAPAGVPGRLGVATGEAQRGLRRRRRARPSRPRPSRARVPGSGM